MVLLVAVSVPMLKPMLEQQRTKIAAQTVAAALQRVRFKAMEDNTPYGIKFVPYEDSSGNTTNISLQMRLVKQGERRNNPEDVRARVQNGYVTLYRYDTSNNAWSTELNSSDPEYQHLKGQEIQFGRQGRTYKLDTNDGRKLQGVYADITLPDGNNPDKDAAEYRLILPPRSVLIPPVVLPRGTVVDLEFSHGKTGTDEKPIKDYTPFFTPNGYVDYVHKEDGLRGQFYGGLIYICVGEWDRQKTNGVVLAEDGKNNIEVMTNYWVTLNPMTGQVRVTPMGPADAPKKFAAEHWGLSE